MELKEVINYLDNVFELSSFNEPSAYNGLQVEGKRNIQKIGFSVDATTETIQKAASICCDMLIVHHGIFWPSINCILGHDKKRIKLLLDNDISLVGIHLPLDKHIEIGNNVELIKLLGGRIIDKFGSVSYLAQFDEEKKVSDIAMTLDSRLQAKSKVFDFSYGKVKTFGVCTGGGSGELYSLFGRECDLFITGEIKYSVIDNAKECGISLIVSGHYATETLGIKALMTKISKDLNIKTEFIESKIDF